jgi:uncharacterized protein
VSVYLLDVNVLIAILDPRHLHHDVALGWFEETDGRRWASCPLTENGFVRIVGQSSYLTPLDPYRAIAALRGFQAASSHVFWPDSISILDRDLFAHLALTSPRHITDVYLLALACRNDGIMVTFDRKLLSDAVTDAAGRLLVLDQ